MRALLRADWLRIRRRWEVWVITFGIVGLSFVGYLNGAHSARVTFLTPEGMPIHVMDPAPYTFPASIATAVSSGAAWFLFGFAFLAATLLGSEFDWGTIRNVALVRPDRHRYLAARLLWILALAGSTFAGLLAVGTIGPILLPVDATDAVAFGGPASVTLGAALAVSATWLVIGVAAIALAGTTALIFRSGAMGVLAAAVYAFADMFIANFLVAQLGRPVSIVAQFSLTTRLMTLITDVTAAVTPNAVTTGPDRMPGWIALPGPLGTTVVAAWLVGLFAFWFWRIRTIDINE